MFSSHDLERCFAPRMFVVFCKQISRDVSFRNTFGFWESNSTWFADLVDSWMGKTIHYKWVSLGYIATSYPLRKQQQPPANNSNGPPTSRCRCWRVWETHLDVCKAERTANCELRTANRNGGRWEENPWIYRFGMSFSFLSGWFAGSILIPSLPNTSWGLVFF